MNNRRKFIIAFGAAALAAPFGAFAQQHGKVWRIGVLSIGSAATARHLVEAFFKGMADLGYQEGRNVHYEVRYGEGSFEKFEREYVDAKVDLIWTSGTPATTAAQKATESIPICRWRSRLFKVGQQPCVARSQPHGHVGNDIRYMGETRGTARRDISDSSAYRSATQPARLVERSPACLYAQRRRETRQRTNDCRISHAKGVCRRFRPTEGMAGAGIAERRIHAVSRQQAGAPRWGQ
jgi:hypothetical protein